MTDPTLLWAGAATTAALALFIWGAVGTERGHIAARHADDCDARIGYARRLAEQLLEALGPEDTDD